MSTRTTIPLNEIVVKDRQRRDLGDLTDLIESLRTNKLIQPVVINQERRLIAGGRRIAAATALGWTHIDVVYRETMSEDEIAVLELEENLRRKDETWQEKCLHIQHIHRLKQRLAALDAKTWGQRETGMMLGESAANINFALVIARKLEAELKEKGEYGRFGQCESLKEALDLRMRDEEDELLKRMAEVQRQQTADIVEDENFLQDLDKALSMPGAEETIVVSDKPYSELTMEEAKEKYLRNPLNDPSKFDEYWNERQRLVNQRENTVFITNKLIHGDSIAFMNDSENAGRFDHVITDIPYGIDMAMLNQQNPHGGMVDIDTVEELHDVEYNLKLIADFFPAAFKCTKEHAFCITWCDLTGDPTLMMKQAGCLTLWEYMMKHALAAGFKIQRWPVTWKKTHRCMNQANTFNTTKDTEVAIVCRKPGATLAWQPDTSVIECQRDDLCEAIDHPFAKPYLAWERLVNMASIEGQSILEPFAGRGSGVISMLRMNRNVVGVELDDAHYNRLLENVKTLHYLKLNPNFVFK